MSSFASTVSVPRCPVIFDGLNYQDWFQHMRLHMRGQCLWDFLTSVLPCPSRPTPPAESVLPKDASEDARTKASEDARLGYERLAYARLGVPEVEDIVVDTAEDNQTTSSLLEMDSGPSAANTSTTTATSNDDGSNFDMFGDNDDISDVNRDSDAKTVSSGSNPEPAPQIASGTSVAEKADNGNVGSDYVFDSTSGYYYSSSTGYYYDLTSGCYCSATTGTWYSYDEQTGAYKEIQDEQTGGTLKELQGDGITE